MKPYPRYLLVLFLLLLALAPLGAQQDPNVTVHVVQRGENLFRIAQRYGQTVEDIARFNGITNPAAIQVGQRLLIPADPAPVIVPPQSHTVRPGDNLQSIASAYGVDAQALITLNGITNPDRLYVGQVLTITPQTETVPTAIPTANPAATLVAAPVADPATSTRHVIERGETLFSIAQRYGISQADLQAANNILDPSRILAGQALIIPGIAPAEEIGTAQLPPSIASVEVTPLTWTEASTGRIRVTTTNAAQVTMDFLSRALNVVALPENVHTAYVAIPFDTPAGIYPLTMVVVDAAGVTSFSVNIQVEAGAYGSQRITLPADRANLAAKAVDDNEYSILARVAQPVNPERYIQGPMSLPAAAPMNGAFGAWRSYNGGPFDRRHLGSDFAGAPGTPVYAAAAGRVVLADTLNVRGITVMIDHGWGIYTAYAHMAQRTVNLGDYVSAGQNIGTVGTTGRSTGAHLHWEVWLNGLPVDPMQWVAQAFP